MSRWDEEVKLLHAINDRVRALEGQMERVDVRPPSYDIATFTRTWHDGGFPHLNSLPKPLPGESRTLGWVQAILSVPPLIAGGSILRFRELFRVHVFDGRLHLDHRQRPVQFRDGWNNVNTLFYLIEESTGRILGKSNDPPVHDPWDMDVTHLWSFGDMIPFDALLASWRRPSGLEFTGASPWRVAPGYDYEIVDSWMFRFPGRSLWDWWPIFRSVSSPDRVHVAVWGRDNQAIHQWLTIKEDRIIYNNGEENTSIEVADPRVIWP